MPRVELEFIADVTCPWCYIGFGHLQSALDQLADEISVQLSWHPFEINLDLPEQGVPLDLFLAKRYGMDEAAIGQQYTGIAQQAQAAGLALNLSHQSRIYNTRAAHKLLLWAAESGQQTELKQALFDAYFVRGQAIDETPVLLECVANAGLPAAEAEEVLESPQWTEKVHEAELQWLSLGVHAVPALVVNQQHLISGLQPVETLVEALRDLAETPS